MSVAYECAADTEGALLEAVTPSEDFDKAVRFIALQALGEQRIDIDAQIRRLYRKRDRVDVAIAEAKRGIEGTFHGDGFDIAPRRAVSRKFQQLSPSQRRAERRKALNNVEAA